MAAPKKKAKRAPKQKRPAAAMQEMTLTGTISKMEKKGKGDKVSVSYILTDAEGTKIRLPVPRAPKKKKGGEAAPAVINLADFVDQQVKVVGMGRETKRGDKKSIQLRTITTVEKLETPAAVAGDDAAGGGEAAGGEAAE